MPGKTAVCLHVCCAPCLARTRRSLAGCGWEIGKMIFFNPNIHPLIEFRRRAKALRIYLERESLTAEIDDRYGLAGHLAAVLENGTLPADRAERCLKCCLLRFVPVAARARETGMAGFSTTLLASREQDRDLIREAGRMAAKKAGTEFFDGDFSLAEPPEKEMKGIYRQQYCGCVFSEAERYAPTNRHL